MSSPIRITITGDLGSGKTLVSRLLSERLGLELHSTGSIQRRIAEERGLTTLELNTLSEEQREVDDTIDAHTRALGETDASFVMDSRLAWHFIPHSVKCFLTVDAELAASRIMHDGNRRSEGYADVASALREIAARKASEYRRFKELYDIDCGDMSNYDVIVDTSALTPDQVADRVLEHLAS